VDEMIAAGVAFRSIPNRLSDSVPVPSVSAIGRHARDHVSPALVRLAAQREDGRAGSLLDQLTSLRQRVGQVLDRAEADGKVSSFLAASREIRSILELTARLSGELVPDAPTVQVVNVLASPDFVDAVRVIDRALERWPDARIEVAQALRGDGADVLELAP
jgi:hypothetical protein